MAEQTPTTTDGYLTLEQAAVYLQAPPATIRGWMRRKGLPYYKPGKRVQFRKQELDLWKKLYKKGLSGLALARLVDQYQAG